MQKGKLLRKDQCGQGLTEYAVILCLVAVASIAAMALFGGAVKAKIAGLTGAVAGRSAAEIDKTNDTGKSIAKDAADKAKDVKGNMSIDKDSTFDKQSF